MRRSGSPTSHLRYESASGRLIPMIDAFAKEYLHNDLCAVRQTMLSKAEGL
jgi:hypothetical protein